MVWNWLSPRRKAQWKQKAKENVMNPSARTRLGWKSRRAKRRRLMEHQLVAGQIPDAEIHEERETC